MSTGIIELNDSGLRVANRDQAILLESPGYALISDRELLLGDSARQQSRLHPLNTHNTFWQHLNLDPLSPAPSGKAASICRHHADLAYAHLKALHQLAQGIEDVVFAIPGSFNRDQLALLLGIAQECAFNAVGLVDSATAALAPVAQPGQHLHLDIQLHQSVITRLDVGQQVVRQQVDVVPGAGIVALYDAWARYIAEQFILHTRFDPLHTADTEQQLYNQLPSLLEQCQQLGETTLELQGYKVAIALEALRQKSEAVFASLIRRLQKESRDLLYISDRWQKIPGITEQLTNTCQLDAPVIQQGCLSNLEHIRGKPNAALSFITSLPASDAASIQRPTIERSLATHLLSHNQAYPLSQRLYVSGTPHLHLSLSPSSEDIGYLEYDGGKLTLTNNNEQRLGSLKLNGQALQSGDRLHVGDNISWGDDAVSLSAISVLGTQHHAP